ncbi:hypothetical protein [Halioxenophilus sp. WMMB6]|uniref:hypothetical protein n=1 Tax=Halioxenophilus sp. WMMB6 TaxID=3073815 RepID=UPI00295F4E3A|nr:hypothetical protein [Halioxenophilus sp. WMMB6]
MAATFELKTTGDSIFQFDFYNGKGDQLMMSAEFASKSEAEQAIQEVRVGSMMSDMIAVGTGPEGEKFFVIKNRGGQVLVKSVLFENEMVFNNALHSVRDNACIAQVKDCTAVS